VEVSSRFPPPLAGNHILSVEVVGRVVQKVGTAHVAALAFDFQEVVEDEKVMVQP